MLTPDPMARPVGAMIQNATLRSCRSKKLHSGQEAKVIGQAYEQIRSTHPVPYRSCTIGNTMRTHRSCEIPIAAKNMEIWKGVKPRPPYFTSVNQNRGKTILTQVRNGDLETWITHQLYMRMQGAWYVRRGREQLQRRVACLIPMLSWVDLMLCHSQVLYLESRWNTD